MKFLSKSKIIAGFLVVALAGGYFWYTKTRNGEAEVQYVTAPAQKTTISSSVSATGQVVASTQLDVTPKSAGEITSVVAKVGQRVETGDVLAYIDASDVYQSVEDAQADLESAQISLQKTMKSDDSALRSATNAVSSAEDAVNDAQNNLENAREDGYNTIADVTLRMPDILTDVEDVFERSYLGTIRVSVLGDTAEKYRDDARDKTYDAEEAMDEVLKKYKALSRDAGASEIQAVLQEAHDAAVLLSDAVKATINLLDYVERKSSSLPEQLEADNITLDAATGDINGVVTDLTGALQEFESSYSNYDEAQRTLDEKKDDLSEEQGDPLDIQSAQLTVRQRQNALERAQAELADYTIRAPFSGVIAQVKARAGDEASAGDVIAVLITESKLAEVSLNEVDVAQIDIGDKATLAFDAFEDLSITGQVAEVDMIGAADQGVVSYTIKIAFDTQDERVLPSMTVNASVITDVKTDVVAVANAAVKSNANGKYVQMLDENNQPANIQVVVGLSNDTMTEIVSGISEGDKVITQTINPNSATTTNTGGNQTGIPGLGGAPTGGNFSGGRGSGGQFTPPR